MWDFLLQPKTIFRNSDASRFSVQYGLTRITSDGVDTIPAQLVILNDKYVAGYGYVNDVAVIKVNNKFL